MTAKGTLSPVHVLLGVSVIATIVREGFQNSVETGRYDGTPFEPYVDRLRVVCASLEESSRLAFSLADEVLAEAMKGFNISIIAPQTKEGGSPANRPQD